MPPDPGRSVGTHRLHCDGAARGNPGPAGIGVVLEDPQGETIGEIAEGIGTATNNVAEYRALIAGLELARDRGVRRLQVYCDSVLVVQQMRGAFRVRHGGLKPLHATARDLAGHFESVELIRVPREANRRADNLANRGVDEGPGAGAVRKADSGSLF